MYLLFTGTTVMSDMWAAYNLQHMGYAHMTVNHTLNFVDPVTHATTNHIESIWQKAKQAHKRRRYGTHQNLLSTYMAKFMWRRKFPEKAFEQLLVDIRQQYPLGENL